MLSWTDAQYMWVPFLQPPGSRADRGGEGGVSCSDKFLGAARGAGGGDGVFGCRFALGA